MSDNKELANNELTFDQRDPPEWEDTQGDHEFSATISGGVVLNEEGVQMGDSDDMFAAFDDSMDVRGIALMLFPPFGPYEGTPVFEMQVRSNDEGDHITFKYYDASEDHVFDIVEDYTFAINDILGNMTDPNIYNIRDPDLSCPVCVDDDDAVAPLNCATVVGFWGCEETPYGDSNVLCPITCGACPVEDACGVCEGDGPAAGFDCDGNALVVDILGCTDVGACNYDSLATEEDSTCTYPQLYYADLDSDGFGSGDGAAYCGADIPDNYVDNNADEEPNCATNDTDDCGVCAGLGATYECGDAASTLACNEADCPALSCEEQGLWDCGDGQCIETISVCEGVDYLCSLEADCDNGADEGLGNCANVEGYVNECVVLGCTDVGACNYDSLATEEDGSCTYPQLHYADLDSDGFGSGDGTAYCGADIPDNYVDNNADEEPNCATNDTDDCGECGGSGPLDGFDCDGNYLVVGCNVLDIFVENSIAVVESASHADGGTFQFSLVDDLSFIMISTKKDENDEFWAINDLASPDGLNTTPSASGQTALGMAFDSAGANDFTVSLEKVETTLGDASIEMAFQLFSVGAADVPPAYSEFSCSLDLQCSHDVDGDGICDAGDLEDTDNDGCLNSEDDNLLVPSGDTDLDGTPDDCDSDDDDDSVVDIYDSAPLDPALCSDFDGDTCDDCTSGTFNTLNDGIDTDGDGQCDTGDPDDDNDGVSDVDDNNPKDHFICSDLDADMCDDCTSGSFNKAIDGFDFDMDGRCDAGDLDDDNDLCPDEEDDNPWADGPDTDNDGTDDDCDADDDDDGCLDGADKHSLSYSGDFDNDGQADDCDPDDDNDSALDGADTDDNNSNICSDDDRDGCDDCSSGTYNVAGDGADYDADGLCDLHDQDWVTDLVMECDFVDTDRAQLAIGADFTIVSCPIQLIKCQLSFDAGIPKDYFTTQTSPQVLLGVAYSSGAGEEVLTQTHLASVDPSDLSMVFELPAPSILVEDGFDISGLRLDIAVGAATLLAQTNDEIAESFTSYETSLGKVIDTSCGVTIPGCMDVNYGNYDEEATTPDILYCIDKCGVAGGDNTTCLDCNLEVNGSAITDECNVCVGGTTGLDACTEDCKDDWGGGAVKDCAGVCDGTSDYDGCGVCDDDPDNDCTEDCNGVFGGKETLDACNVCGGDDSSCIDACGVADLDDTNDNACLDCAGVPYGDSMVGNACGTCGIHGDLNGDLSVNISDFVMIVNVIVELESDAPYDCAHDVNDDQLNNIADVAAEMLYVMGDENDMWG